MGFINVGPDGNAPQSTIQNLYQLTDNVSWVKGKHSFKFGFDGRKYISPAELHAARPRRLRVGQLTSTSTTSRPTELR